MQYDRVKYLFYKSCKPIWLVNFLLILFIVGKAQSSFINDSVAILKFSEINSKTIKKINLLKLPFYKTPENQVNFGFAGNTYTCIVLKLNAPSIYEMQVLSIDNTSLDTIDIYRVYTDGSSQLLYQGGCLVNFNKNSNYVWHTTTLQICSATSFYLIAMKAPQKNINLRYEIISEHKLQKKYECYNMLVYFYTGIISIFLMTILFACFLFKNNIFAAYFGYIVCFGSWVLLHYGRLFPMLYPELPVINQIAKPISSLGASFFLILVLYLFFKKQLSLYPLLKKIIIGMLYFLPAIISCMLLLLIHNLMPIFKNILVILCYSVLLLSIFIIIATPLFFVKINFITKIFCAAIMVICFTAIVQLFSNAGYITNFFIKEHGMTTGSLIEMTILAFGLFYNLLTEKKRTEKQVLSLEQEQSEILKKLFTVQDNERKRIAGDLHDNIGPLLAALKINFRRIIHTKEQNIQEGLVAKTESIIDDSIAEIRNVAHNLMPKGLSTNGLINTLKEYFEGVETVYNKTIVFHHQLNFFLTPNLQINIYRIICELVLNAARHSSASLIHVRITAIEKCVCFSIDDDGQGFKASLDHQRSFGLQSAESRVRYLNGKFYLNSSPGNGTHIIMEIPITAL